MKVIAVSICPTEAAQKAGRPALTPELLAASGARYSRNNEGLEAILSKIDPDNLDKSVDSIFKMIDYGHQSIADMAPIAMFIDELSILLAYLVWSWCPTAGGQESSTRYIKLDRAGLVDPSAFGLPDEDRDEWFNLMDQCFEAYGEALTFWERVGDENPELSRIPTALLNDPSEKAQKQVARMKRNYAFDRARYFLPVAAKTNMMLIMSARGWVQLCQNLLSHWLPEANTLGAKIREELALSAPRLVKHAERKESSVQGFLSEFELTVKMARETAPCDGEAECLAEIDIYPPIGVTEDDLVEALRHHDNRYAFIGSAVCRTAVRFSWTAVAIAEIRDLNRHRTGQKHCPLVPLGFYSARDQLPTGSAWPVSLQQVGSQMIEQSRARVEAHRADYVAYIVLGSQFPFEHTTTLDKYVYEAELRTGTGAHYRYAAHLLDSLGGLRSLSPALTGQILAGSAEPE